MKYTPIILKVERNGKPVGTVVLDRGLHRRLHLFARENENALAEFIAGAIAYAVGPDTMDGFHIPEIIAVEDEQEAARRRAARRKEMERAKQAGEAAS